MRAGSKGNDVILPSDAAKDRFPNNKAAEFSIPIDDAQQLTGQWEVAVAQSLTFQCVNTLRFKM